MHDTDHAAAILQVHVRVPMSGTSRTREQRRGATPVVPRIRAVSIAALRPEIVFPRADLHPNQTGAPLLPCNADEAVIVAPKSTFPSEWTVEIKGFAGSEHAERLNGRYLLQLVAGEHEEVCWRGGGDGESATKAELTTRPIERGDWRLKFVLGDGEVVYSKTANDWNDVGANVLTDLEVKGCFMSAAIPYSATVVPS